MISPTRSLKIRGPDALASEGGAFGARRSKGTKIYEHPGIDLVSGPWSVIHAPFDYEIRRTGMCYFDKGMGLDVRYTLMELDSRDGLWRVRLLYVWPFYRKGSTGSIGKAIGLSQDLKFRHPGITQHCHFEARKRRSDDDYRLVDPTGLLSA